MKTATVFFMVILLVSVGCGQQEPKFPQGAWQFAQGISVAGDTMETYYPGVYTGLDIKIWSEKHFFIIFQLKIDTTFMDGYLGGTYTIDGNRYKETVLYLPEKYQTMVNKEVDALLELRNDTLIQTYPVDENGKPIKSGYKIEKFVRLK